jgi:phage terminase large subunit GpA-like protein
MLDRANPLVRGFFDVFKVPTRRTVTQWADDKRMLPSKGAAEPGKYRSARTPYMREPMDCLSVLSPVEEVCLMAAAQTGKSESGNNWVGYVIDEAPGPMLLVQPTVDNAKRYSKQRISPMILETPELAAKVISNKSREGGNTMLEKEFPGGILILGGANSAAGLRSMPIRFFFGDEISNWPADVDGEGDPLALAVERTNTFGRKRKVFLTSTPGLKGTCRIEAEYLKTDQRRYFVPCPHCGHHHVLEWKNFIIPKDDEGRHLHRKAHMVCPDCGGILEERHKTDMLNGGEWRATAPEKSETTRRGYHISALYSPIGWKSWAKIAKQWLEAQGHPKKLQAFVNNVLAETWEEDYSTKLDADSLAARAETYDMLTAPDGALVLTAGIDVQDNRIEIQVIGWGLGEEAWVINYAIVYGDPDRFEVWQQVLDVINTPVRHASGVDMQVYAALVDSGDGNKTNEVYAFARENRARHVLAIKGFGGSRPPIGQPSRQDINIRGQKIKKGALLYPVGADSIKSTIFGRLKRTEREGPGVIHFPLGLHTDYYPQLTSEVQVIKFVNGVARRQWRTKKEGDRNEALDTFVYAYAGLHYVMSRYNRATFWTQMASRLAKVTAKMAESRELEAESPEIELKPQVLGHSAGKISLSGLRRGA